MKKIIFLTISLFLFTGCSLIPRVTFSKAGVVAQESVKSKKKIKCSGDIILNEDGTVNKCTRGFYQYQEDSNVKERKTTLKEKLLGFLNNFAGISFWGVILLIILFPGLLGVIAGRIIEAVQGIGSKALKQIVKGVQKSKTEEIPLATALEVSTDDDVKKFITKFKSENNIK